MGLIDKHRSHFHNKLLDQLVTIDSNGVTSIADSANELSKEVSRVALNKLGTLRIGKKLAGQSSGKLFEKLCKEYLEETFFKLDNLRPGNFNIKMGTAISDYSQYKHLQELKELSDQNPKISTTVGQDYLIKPDVVIVRHPESDEKINEHKSIVSGASPVLSPLRSKNNSTEILHATISCKYTIRSDRAQNARSEALNVIRNRKGRTPHIVVITTEPLPSRLASLALGTGDLDCVYHVFLNELEKAINELGKDDATDLLEIMIEGDRLRDIADLPLDLAI